MNQRRATTVLLVYFATLWLGVAVRFDYFPLTWVPMYSEFDSSPELCIRAKSDARLAQGLRVTRWDGSTSDVSQHDLNIPRWNFWRLYSKRMFSTGPPLHIVRDDWKKNANMSAVNKWIHGTAGTERPEEGWGEGRWEWATFRSLNATLGHQPDDPEFVVGIETFHVVGCYETADPSRSRTFERNAVWAWKPVFGERWRAAHL